MQVPRSPSHDVVVVGAGPVGLLLACELRLGGCSVLVLEREHDARSPLKDAPFGLRGLTVPTVESFDRRGLLEPLREAVAARGASAPPHVTGGARKAGGHFAGIPFFVDQVDVARWPWRLDLPAGGIAAEMSSIEAVLEAHARASGAEIRRGCAVDDVEQSGEDVLVRTNGGAFRARWVVGCDGGRSVVRKAVGFGFAGTEPEFTGYSVQVELDDAGKLAAGRHYTPTGMVTFAPPGTIAMVDFDGGAFHRTRPVTREHVQTVLRRVSGTDVAVTALRLATTWTDRAFAATEYRRGRTLLAGDAAHVHSPLGGQGLNLGIGDAMDLGWKLAAVVRGDAPDALLDTYARERMPVAAQVLDWSRAQVALMRPSPSSRALEAIVRDLMATRDGATYFAARAWGVGSRYALGDGHPSTGRSAPDFRFVDGTRLNERLRDGRWVLVEFGSRRSLRDRERQIAHVAMDAEERMGLDALLVRPDGVVAWARDASGDEADVGRAGGEERLREVLSHAGNSGPGLRRDDIRATSVIPAKAGVQ